jgi:hypothetical protein
LLHAFVLFSYTHDAKKKQHTHNRTKKREKGKTDISKAKKNIDEQYKCWRERQNAQKIQLSHFDFVHLIAQSLLESATATAA